MDWSPETWKNIAQLGIGTVAIIALLIFLYKYIQSSRDSFIQLAQAHAEKLESIEEAHAEKLTGLIDISNGLCRDTNNHLMTLFKENMGIIERNTSTLAELATLIKVIMGRKD